MNREIKYKSLYRGEWYEVEEASFYDGEICPNKFKGHKFSPDLEHVKCTVQFIGLQDKNDVDIYEDDIVDVKNMGKGIVKFGVACYDSGYYETQGYFIDWVNISDNDHSSGYLLDKYTLEVIGNTNEQNK